MYFFALRQHIVCFFHCTLLYMPLHNYPFSLSCYSSCILLGSPGTSEIGGISKVKVHHADDPSDYAFAEVPSPHFQFPL